MSKIEGNIVGYSDRELAKTHKQLQPATDRQSVLIRQDFETLTTQGYVIIEDLLTPEQCDEIKNSCLPLMSHTGRNNFEGEKTQRLYNVLAKTRCIDNLADHPRILGLMDLLFKPNFLLSQSQVINILPGEKQQALHFDDGFYQIPRPRPPLGAASIWAIDDFTKENGATHVVPQSQNWDGQQRPTDHQSIQAVMPAGSVIFFLGTTWHGGGANQTQSSRLAVTHQYCEAFLRQQENFLLELNKETVKSLSPELRALVGYSIHPPFMGMVNGQHPLRTLDE
ncbi:phytanoyl-CoA dioxygenase family protein [uncultured Paraglaciecola sp.]|uniref:phytanoyl-CoA dioxygenase family protein n=1 Tax=uncultured Paraglaciecola sp. TaxID=1765024 RepID=UPI00261CD933|nr:phytanoyl-CoA dioxygenase family protein [uncultured Paraglaciecola sp.]